MVEKMLNIIQGITKLPQNEINLDLNILESNIISSLALLEIISKIEKEFQVKIESEELIPENFGTIRLILSFVERKLGE